MVHNIGELEVRLEYKSYQRYYEKKLALQKKYPQYKTFGTDDYRNYLRGVGDLITYDADFQEFIWDIMSQADKDLMETRARRRLNTGIIEY